MSRRSRKRRYRWCKCAWADESCTMCPHAQPHQARKIDDDEPVERCSAWCAYKKCHTHCVVTRKGK